MRVDLTLDTLVGYKVVSKLESTLDSLWSWSCNVISSDDIFFRFEIMVAFW